ncbi:hypothetical protein [Cyanobium sp. Morenito 9A2]|uniref:hypothetical protein n=1 Tax=Cyanobium sp. Morenito 9A2 TaxID=2823718 RepID=UPI0020CD04A7|nr:hypothetical protein [Cyanobium sp. Morenito 9A2]MCP9848598.1 hypothetical protein [Cyanobium sp. Morenito 9A2]
MKSLSQAPAAALMALLHDGSARYQKPRRMGTAAALLILLASTLKIAPSRPQGKMEPH